MKPLTGTPNSPAGRSQEKTGMATHRPRSEGTGARVSRSCCRAAALMQQYMPTATLCFTPRLQKFSALKRGFPGGPMLKTLPSNAEMQVPFLVRELRPPHAWQAKIQNIKQKQYSNRFNKDFKN